MRRLNSGLLVVLAATAINWACGLRLACGEPVAQPTADLALPDPSPFRYIGTASCAASACHGGNAPAGRKGSEYTTWMTNDPHSRAYTVLYTERSRRMVAKLKQPGAAPPDKNALCLACHALSAPADRLGSGVTLLDGVGCENCHGPAEKWLGAHVLPDWAARSAVEKRQLGMQATKDLTIRGRDCAACHVGSARADVGHLLIAAGHPRLRFEYSSYLAALPKHWSENDERARNPDLKARVWQIGQRVATQAALDLLAERARDERRPWPEFAEYDCFACHHDVRDPGGWPGKRAQNLDGSLTWGTWYYAGTRAIKDTPEETRLRAQMHRAYPDRQQVHELARRLSGVLSQAAEPPFTKNPAALRERLEALVAGEAQAPPGGWDEAAQHFVARAALAQTLGDLDPNYRNPALQRSLEERLKKLKFPKGFDSPRLPAP